MILKIVFWGAAILLLTACGNSEPANEDEQAKQTEETIIGLESNEKNESVDSTNFNQNSKIDSKIYKEFFFAKQLLPKNQMESDVVDELQIAYGNQLPINIDNFPVPYYMDYTF